MCICQLWPSFFEDKVEFETSEIDFVVENTIETKENNSNTNIFASEKSTTSEKIYFELLRPSYCLERQILPVF